jgi:hypothetical protein
LKSLPPEPLPHSGDSAVADDGGTSSFTPDAGAVRPQDARADAAIDGDITTGDAGAAVDVTPPKPPVVDASPRMDADVQPAPPMDANPPVDTTPRPPDLGTTTPALPASTWTEHWYEHKEVMRLGPFNDHVALYLEPGLQVADVAWVLPFVTKLWTYTKAEYGSFGTDARAYWLLHQGRFIGGHAGGYLEPSHGFRNVIDFGAVSLAQSPASMSRLASLVGSVVERFNNGVRGAPAAEIWRGHFAALFEVDVYVALGMDAEAQQTHERLLTTTDALPRAGTYWYRDWFLPLWQEQGRAKVMATFFRLLAQHYPKRPDVFGRSMTYSRTMTWGEFVHFMSGAAGRDLKPLATKAFGWPIEWNLQLAAAKLEFPSITY